MPEILNQKDRKITDKDNSDFEAKHNLFGFFDLLLNIDIRNNPQNYKKKSYENNRDTNCADQSQ